MTLELFPTTKRTISLTLPWPPALNNLYLTVMSKGRPIRVKSPEARAFHEAVRQLCLVNRIKPLYGDLCVTVDAYRPRKVGDLDGIFKITFDSLKGWAMEDDKQITKIIAERFDDKHNPRIEIQITEL